MISNENGSKKSKTSPGVSPIRLSIFLCRLLSSGAECGAGSHRSFHEDGSQLGGAALPNLPPLIQYSHQAPLNYFSAARFLARLHSNNANPMLAGWRSLRAPLRPFSLCHIIQTVPSPRRPHQVPLPRPCPKPHFSLPFRPRFASSSPACGSWTAGVTALGESNL